MTVASVPLRSGALLLHGDDDLAAVGDARHAVDSWLREHDIDDDTSMMVLLITSELVTNSVSHAEGGFVLTVGATRTGITVRVADHDPTVPCPTRAADEDTHGRGLALVAELSDAWGCDPLPFGGKVVWAHVPTS